MKYNLKNITNMNCLCFFFFYFRKSTKRAGSNPQAGQRRPAGHMFDTPILKPVLSYFYLSEWVESALLPSTSLLQEVSLIQSSANQKCYVKKKKKSHGLNKYSEKKN